MVDNAGGRRASTRSDVDIYSTLTVDTVEHGCTVNNISLGGVQIDCSVPLVVGKRVGLRFAIREVGMMIDGHAFVRWRKGEQIGLQFDGLRAQEVWALNQFLRGPQRAAG